MKRFCNSPGDPWFPQARPRNPKHTTPTGLDMCLVWALPISLATTLGIAIAFSSWRY